MTWRNDYSNKLRSPDQALLAVQSGERVLLGTLGSEPQTLVEALIAGRERLRDVKLLVQVAGSHCLYSQPGMEAHFRVVALFASPYLREAMAAGHADFLPISLSEIPRLIYERVIPIDVALVSVSPPDGDGYCSLGVSADIIQAAIDRAGIVVAEVNDQMPRARGDCFVQVSQFDHVVETSRPLISVPNAKLTPVEIAIGRNVANLVDDRATIEFGIGAVPNAVLAELGDRRDLGVHTGLISDGLVDLVEKGAVTGRYKEIDQGKIVTALALGSERLYRFMHENPTIAMRPASYTHNATILSRLSNLVAINGALEIDLSGQINAETIDGVQIGGIGGQADFMRAAARAPGGKSIICLQSTAVGGRISRIVPQLKPGTPVSCPRYDVHYVATEFGVVDLWGKTLRERAELLAGIAHPDFRDGLLDESKSTSPRRHREH